MALTFQQKLTLESGSVVFYHEGSSRSGELFHVLILVEGKDVEAYFQYISTQQDFAVSTLVTFGRILHCDIGSMSQNQIDESMLRIRE